MDEDEELFILGDFNKDPIYPQIRQNWLDYMGSHGLISMGRLALSVGHMTRKSEVLGSIPSLATYFVSPSADSRGQLSVTGESMCTKYWLTA